MLLREAVPVYFENHTEHTDTLCGQNAEFCCVKTGGINSDHWALNWSMAVWHIPHVIVHSLVYFSVLRPGRE
jgi:hypothetical protein